MSSTSTRPAGEAGPAGAEGPRKYLIGGNWKSNGTVAATNERIEMLNGCGPIPANVEVVVCAPSIHLPQLLAGLRDDIAIGAQDSGLNNKDGAFTGEIGPHQFKDLGCTWVIIGHSERREGFGGPGESEELCAKKCKAAIDSGLFVMFAVGEKKEERESGVTMTVVEKQLAPLVKELSPEDWAKVAIAYEPVWA